MNSYDFFIYEFGCTKVPDAASVQACARKESLAEDTGKSESAVASESAARRSAQLEGHMRRGP